MSQQEDTDWVEVAAVGQDGEASLIAGLLESEGIPCEVEGRSSHPLPENLGSFGMSRVVVPPDRAAQAREVLADRERAFEEDEAPPSPEETDE